MYVRVDRTEVTLDPADFLLEDLVPEPGLEFTLPKRRRRHTHSILITPEKDIGLARSKRGTVQWSLGDVSLQYRESACFV